MFVPGRAIRPTMPPMETVFQGVRFDVATMQIPGNDGKSHRREVVVHPGAVVILPLLADQQVAMIRNERFAVDLTLWELPAGTLEPDEDPADCAGREVVEETGYQAAKITKLTDFYTSPGICTERMWAYLAEDLTHVGQDLDESERITVEVLPLNQTMQMIEAGDIRDGKTIATLLYYKQFGRNL